MFRREYYAYFVVMLLCVTLLIVANMFSHNSCEVEVITPSDSVMFNANECDSIHINTANAYQLRKFGFSYRAVYSLIAYRDAGGKIRNWEKLKVINGVDSARLIAKKSLVLYDDVAANPYAGREFRKWNNDKDRWYNNFEDNSRSEKRYKRIGLFYADSAELAVAGVKCEVWDSIVDYRNRYTLKGSVRIDSLVEATSGTIGQLLKSHIMGKKIDYAKSDEYYKEQTCLKVIELNEASIGDLVGLKQIGEKSGKAILDYRDKLGGFVSVEQLREVWLVQHFGNYEIVASQCVVDKSKVRMLDANKLNSKTLMNHPYVTRKVYSVWSCALLDGIVLRNVEDFRKIMRSVDYNPLLEEYLQF